MKQTEVDVVVIGAGITGLVTALNLIKTGKRVLILEKSDRAGGQMNTVSDQGFVFETGPNTGVLNNVEIVRLFNQLPNQQAETARKESKIRLIWKGQSFRALPSGLISAVFTPLFTFGDKIRICFEPFRAKGKDPMESIADLSKRRLGHSFFQYAVDPFVSGVYAGDPNKLVTKYAMAKLYNLEQKYGSFIGGSLRMPHPKKSAEERLVTKEVFSVAGGFKQLALAITEAMQEGTIRFSAGDLKLEPQKGRFRWKTILKDRDEEVLSNHVVTTVPAYALSDMLTFANPEVLEKISCMPYAPVVQVGVGVLNQTSHVPQSFGGLVPSCENKNVLGILFPSSCFNQRAPINGATLSFFLGGRKHPEILTWSDDDIRQTVEEAMVGMLGFPKGYHPDVVHIFRHERAIPQYEADSEARLQAINLLQTENPGLILAGGIRDGIGIGDRIKQAATIARSISSKN